MTPRHVFHFNHGYRRDMPPCRHFLILCADCRRAPAIARRQLRRRQRHILATPRHSYSFMPPAFAFTLYRRRFFISPPYRCSRLLRHYAAAADTPPRFSFRLPPLDAKMAMLRAATPHDSHHARAYAEEEQRHSHYEAANEQLICCYQTLAGCDIILRFVYRDGVRCARVFDVIEERYGERA